MLTFNVLFAADSLLETSPLYKGTLRVSWQFSQKLTNTSPSSVSCTKRYLVRLSSLMQHNSLRTTWVKNRQWDNGLVKNVCEFICTAMYRWHIFMLTVIITCLDKLTDTPEITGLSVFRETWMNPISVCIVILIFTWNPFWKQKILPFSWNSKAKSYSNSPILLVSELKVYSLLILLSKLWLLPMTHNMIFHETDSCSLLLLIFLNFSKFLDLFTYLWLLSVG